MTDREILRMLAKTYSEVAHLDVHKEKAKLYRALNGLKPVRSIVLMDEIPWSQLSGQDELKLLCAGEKEREVETYFRRVLYKWNHFRCDMIVNNFFPCHRHIHISSEGFEVRENTIEFDVGNNIISHKYIDQIPDEEAIQLLRIPEITLDEAADARDEAWLQDLFGDILPIRMMGIQYAGFFKPWDDISRWRGVEPLLIDLADRPEFTHMLLERMTDNHLALLKKEEDMGLLDAESTYLHCTPGLVDELPGEIINGRVTRKNIWGRGTAQIFASVSAAMHEEFEIAYARRFYEGFGLLYYGCCEPLHRKIDIVRTLPNLRKISITPWADVDMAADQIASDYVMANKPNPAFLAVDNLDESAIRAEIKRALTACKRNHTPVEFVLKDISSVNHHPEHLDRWSEIAMELVQA